jgi:hypothetical protein
MVSESDGGSRVLESGNMLAANDKLHQPLRLLLARAGKR